MSGRSGYPYSLEFNSRLLQIRMREMRTWCGPSWAHTASSTEPGVVSPGTARSPRRRKDGMLAGRPGTHGSTALASDECSKHVMHEAWQDVAAFTDASTWGRRLSPPPLPSPPPSPRPSLPPAVPEGCTPQVCNTCSESDSDCTIEQLSTCVADPGCTYGICSGTTTGPGSDFEADKLKWCVDNCPLNNCPATTCTCTLSPPPSPPPVPPPPPLPPPPSACPAAAPAGAPRPRRRPWHRWRRRAGRTRAARAAPTSERHRRLQRDARRSRSTTARRHARSGWDAPRRDDVVRRFWRGDREQGDELLGDFKSAGLGPLEGAFWWGAPRSTSPRCNGHAWDKVRSGSRILRRVGDSRRLTTRARPPTGTFGGAGDAQLQLANEQSDMGNCTGAPTTSTQSSPGTRAR